MATVDEVVRDIVGAVPGDYGLTAAKWVDNRYKELVNRARFKSLREVGELVIPAPEDTGTVAVTRGSTAVTGSGAQTWETDIGTSTQEYFYFRAATTWYKIASIDSDTTLTLTSEYSEEDAAAATYKIVKRHLPLDSNARWIGTFYHDRRRRRLKGPVAQTVINDWAPERQLVSSDPIYVSQVGTDSSSVIIVEFYPYPQLSELVHYIFWNLPTALTISSTIPAQIDGYILKEGVLIDVYRWKMAEAADKLKNAEMAAFWRNEMRAQKTSWEGRIQEVIKADQGADDVTLIVDMMKGPYVSGDVRSAKDHWLITHQRP